MADKHVRILVVEDNPEDFEILRIMFSKVKHRKYSVENAPDLQTALGLLKNEAADVYLVDYKLGADSGLEFLSQAVIDKCPAPIILLTGFGDSELDLKAMSLGAADFLNKNKLDPDILDRCVRYTLEHKKVEESIRRDQEFLRAIIENALDGVAIIKADGTPYYVSPSSERILGYKPDQGEGAKSPFLYVHPDDLKRAQDFVAGLLSAPGEVRKGEFQIRHQDGSWRVLEVTGKGHSFTAPSFHGVVLNYRDVSLEHKAQEGIRRLAAVVDSTGDAVITVSLEGVVLSWNPAAQRIYGFTPEEIGGRSINLIIPPGRKDELEGVFKSVQKGIPVSNFETQHYDKNKQVVLTSLTISPLKDPSGQVSRASIIARDITEAYRARETRNMLQFERDQLLERLQLQMERMPIACMLNDQNFNLTYWNPAAEKMFGYSFKEVEGKHPNGLIIPPASWPPVEALFKGLALADSPAQGVVTENIRRGGQPIFCEWYHTAMRDSDGHFLGLMSMAVDVTERQKAEGTRAQLAAILEQTSDAVTAVDVQGKLTNWNRGAEALYGYSAEEALGRSNSFLAPSDRLDEVKELRETVLGNNSVSNYETIHLKKDGTRVDVSLTLSPLKDASGNINGVSILARDITEEKKARESLRQHEEKMRLAQKMDALGRLAGGVAHDFNNLLSVIGGNGGFLMSSLPPGDPHREEVEEIQKAVQRGAELTRQLLVFGKRQVSQPKALNLNEISVEMNKMFKRLIDATIDLAIIQDKDLKLILADSGQIQQVLLNLVLNSRDALPKGGSILIETKNVSAEETAAGRGPALPPGDYVRLSVTDTGTGMDEETQKHVFEPFFTTKAGKGTGLGLATVYGIVNQWKGQIFLHSSPNLGTTFELYFPAMEGVSEAESKPKQITLLPHGSETILVAEDEEAVRKIVVRTLEKNGYKVLQGGNGIEAVKAAWDFKGPIHLLLTDTVMPKMNGKQLSEELKKSRPKVKVLFMSGYPREVLAQQGVLDPDIRLIPKPFSAEDLMEQVRRALDDK